MSLTELTATAKMTSKGQVTIPVELRRKLDLREGDSLQFSVKADSVQMATVRKVPRWSDLAGSVPVPEEWKDATWEEIREYAHQQVAMRYLQELSSQTPTSSSDT